MVVPVGLEPTTKGL